MDDIVKEFEEKLAFWNDLSKDERELIEKNAAKIHFKKGEPIHRSDEKCAGLILLLSGEIRIFILSQDGRDVTLYRMRSAQTCVFSASCIFDAVAFDVFIEAAEDTDALLIPIGIYNQIIRQNIKAELYTYKLYVERFSDIMWSMQQILFMRTDARLASFLLDESKKSKSDEIICTHEQIARDIGSAREVVTRLLNYFNKEGMVAISRGKIKILDREKISRCL